MNKDDFTKSLRNWLDEFLKTKFSNYEVVKVIIPDSNLSKLNEEYIKLIPNYSSWDFKPDVLAILLDRKTSETKLVFLNRSISSISLKEIGEINCYAKLANVEFAFLVSTNGVSNEVNILLLENDIRNRLLNYSNEKDIIIFSWNEEKSCIEQNSIIPFDKKEFLLN